MPEAEKGQPNRGAEKGLFESIKGFGRSLGERAMRFMRRADNPAPEAADVSTKPTSETKKGLQHEPTLEELVANYNEAVVGGADKDTLLKMTDQIDMLAEQRKKFPITPEQAVDNYGQAILEKDTLGENVLAKYGAVAENALFLSEKRDKEPVETVRAKFEKLLGSLGLNNADKKSEPKFAQRPQEAPQKYRSENVRSNGAEQQPDVKATKLDKEKPKSVAPKKPARQDVEKGQPSSERPGPEKKADNPFAKLSDLELNNAALKASAALDEVAARKIHDEQYRRMEANIADARAKAEKIREKAGGDELGEAMASMIDGWVDRLGEDIAALRANGSISPKSGDKTGQRSGNSAWDTAKQSYQETYPRARRIRPEAPAGRPKNRRPGNNGNQRRSPRRRQQVG